MQMAQPNKYLVTIMDFMKNIENGIPHSKQFTPTFQSFQLVMLLTFTITWFCIQICPAGSLSYVTFWVSSISLRKSSSAQKI